MSCCFRRSDKILLALLLACGTAHATCPITECNYLDPHYTLTLNAWSNCTTAIFEKLSHAMDMQAVLYPRFGIAWHAQAAEIDAATQSHDTAAFAEIHRRFEDRILRTAEPEALEFYNLMMMKVKQQQAEQCGSMPEPPKGQP
jgi:hypothetical protein